MIINKYFKIVLTIFAVLYAFKCARDPHDFEVFVDAARKIIHGQNIYSPPFAQNLQYYYSPLFALLLAPLAGLPIMVSQFLWIGLSCVLLCRVWILSIAYFDRSQFTPKQMQLWLIIVLFLSLRFILVDIGFVQMTTFLLWCTMESLRLIKRDHYIIGSALLALAINIKLLPLAFVFYLFYRNNFKAGLLSCLFYIIYLYLPALYLGWQRNLTLIHDWFALINPGNKEWTIESDNGPSSLVALIPVYLIDTTGKLTFRRNFVNLPFYQVALILNLVRLFFVLLTFVFLRTFPFKSIKSNLRQFWEMCYIFVAVPLIYPHQQQYSFIYIIPVFVYISYFFILHWNTIKQKMNYLLWIALLVVGFNFSPFIGRDVITSYVCDVLLYFRILTIATILLIPLLWICRPKAELMKPM